MTITFKEHYLKREGGSSNGEIWCQVNITEISLQGVEPSSF
jgi:hypothetical protein